MAGVQTEQKNEVIDQGSKSQNSIGIVRQVAQQSPLVYLLHPRYIKTQTKTPPNDRRRNSLIPKEEFGGAIQSRTGLDGFAIRCITALLSRRLFMLQCFDEKGKHLASLFTYLERETRLELATSTLARLRSTN
jgi:hypothetical protein